VFEESFVAPPQQGFVLPHAGRSARSQDDTGNVFHA
jgi:hypothetical protein